MRKIRVAIAGVGNCTRVFQPALADFICDEAADVRAQGSGMPGPGGA